MGASSRGAFRVTDGAMDKAYIQFAGLTAGKKDSIADIFGTNSINFGGWTQGADGIDYKLSAGGLTFGIAAETPVNNNDSPEDSGDRPDLVAHVSGKAGPVDFAVAAVSHQWNDGVNDGGNGSAILGRIGVTMSNVNVYGWGGMAEDASGYIGNWYDDNDGGPDTDFVNYDDEGDIDSNLWGIGATFTQGAITVGAEYAQYHHDDSGNVIDINDLAVFTTYRVAKNLSVTGEYFVSNGDQNDGSTTASVETFYVRIQRDF